MSKSDISKISFDHDAPFEKIREFGAGVTYIQRGVLFSSGFAPKEILEVIEDDNDIDNMSVEELRKALKSGGREAPEKKPKVEKKPKAEKPKGSARERAAAKLKDFKDEENPDYVQEALSENAKARQAEERVA